jgi:aflatoxin B1 aldehyde reductase
MRFYAYSPLAGGLLVGTAKLKDTATRAGYRQGLAKMMGGDGKEVAKKTHFARQFYTKSRIFTRQARDKHRENYPKNMDVFSQGAATLEASLLEIESACEASGVPMRDAALRWLFHHSPLVEGDGVIVGTSRLSQLTENLESLAADSGPLPEAVLGAIEGAWESASAGALPAYPR